MRALLQRVTRGSVHVADEIVGQVGMGLVVLVGVTARDGEPEAEKLAQKIVNLRIFEDEAGKFNRSLLEVGGELLVVSQFTLYASTRKGRRPSFTDAAAPGHAEPLVNYFCERLSALGAKNVQSGRFGATMEVVIHNQGPVTIWLDTDEG